jgi:hypothetical protein
MFLLSYSVGAMGPLGIKGECPLAPGPLKGRIDELLLSMCECRDERCDHI